jgi:two-component system response regulator NreC
MSPAPHINLTEREIDVLRLIALGHTNGEIAGRLHRSLRTVETHRALVQAKLRVSSRSQLVRYALEQGFVEIPERVASPWTAQ